MNNDSIYLQKGIIDLFDLRGRLIKTVPIVKGGMVDLKTLLAARVDNIVIVKAVAKQDKRVDLK
jgi:hypothetical protein